MLIDLLALSTKNYPTNNVPKRRTTNFKWAKLKQFLSVKQIPVVLQFMIVGALERTISFAKMKHAGNNIQELKRVVPPVST